jgi:hypothetical protein
MQCHFRAAALDPIEQATEPTVSSSAVLLAWPCQATLGSIRVPCD